MFRMKSPPPAKPWGPGGRDFQPGDSRLPSAAGQPRGILENRGKHPARKLSGLSVLVGRMVGRQQDLAIRHFIPRSVPELIEVPALQQTSTPEVIQVSFECDSSQRHHHFQILKAIHFTIQIRRAAGQLLRQWFVAWWRTTRSRRDVEIGQLKAVTTLRRRGLVGKSRLVQDGIHEFAGGIARKRSSGAVRAVGTGREAEDQHTRAWIAEARNRLSPIVATEVGAALFPRDSFPIFDQAGTAGTGNDFAIQLVKPGGHPVTLYAGSESCGIVGGTGQMRARLPAASFSNGEFTGYSRGYVGHVCFRPTRFDAALLQSLHSEL